MAGEVFARDGPVLAAHGTREEAEAIDDGRDLVAAGRVDRLAAVQGFQRREAVRLGLDPVRDGEKGRRPLGRRRT